MPKVGYIYVFFLRGDKTTKNFEIVNLFQINDGKIFHVDNVLSSQTVDGTKSDDFIELINKKLAAKGINR